MEEKYIGKYRLTTDLRGQNSGNARWGFCTYNSNEYFIKEFISPVYPEASAPISDEVRAALVRECSAFEQRKNRLYTAINASTNGNMIGIRSFIRFKSRYYIVTEKVETGKTKVSEIAELSMEKKIILLRYFRDLSQDRTAKLLGLTQVKVSREEKKILAFLREELS